MADFTPKTDIGEVFINRLDELVECSKQNAVAARGGGPPMWCRPEDITASPLTADGNTQVHEAYTREEQEKWFDESTKNRDDKGTRGDLAQIALQGDFLACMERAYRARHQTACQTRLYPSARMVGHGHDFGVIKGAMAGYVKGIDTINKGEIS